MTCRRGRKGHQLAGCAVARRHRQRRKHRQPRRCAGSVHGRVRPGRWHQQAPSPRAARIRQVTWSASPSWPDQYPCRVAFRAARNRACTTSRPGGRRPFPCSVCPPRAWTCDLAVGNATLVQENDSAGQTAPELAVPCRSAAANSPSTGSA